MKWAVGCGCALALLVVVSGVAGAQDGIEGEWLIQADMAGQKMPAQMTVTKEDSGDYTGFISGPQGELEISGMKYEDGEVTFSASLDTGDQVMEFNFSGALKDDAVSGTLDSAMGPIGVVGIRAGFPGTWSITSESQLGTLERTLMVKPDMSGVYKSDDAEYALSNVKADGDKVMFDVTVDVQGQEMPLSFAGTMAGPDLTGAFSTQGQEVATVKGSKKFPEPVTAGPFAGKWEVEVDSPLGLLEHSFEVMEDGSIKYDDGSEVSDVALESAADGVYAFPITIQGYSVVMEATIEDDGSLSGDVIMDGNPVATFEGKKAE